MANCINVSVAVQNEKWNQCVSCGCIVAIPKYKSFHRSKKTKNCRNGDKLSVELAASIYMHHNAFCWPGSHAICYDCEQQPTQSYHISTTTVGYHDIANSRVKHICTILHHIKHKFLLQSQHYAKNEQKNRITFDLTTDKSCKILTRLTKDQICHIATVCNVDSSHVFITLSICKSNFSYRVAGCIFGLSHTTIGDIFNHCFDMLMIHLVPKQLGKVWTREKIQCHTPVFVKKLFQLNKLQIIYTCDGFPFYIEKSGDFDIQKLTYSGKSKRNCLNFHGCVTLDGTFIYINGPYGSDGKNNDQNIFDSLFDKKYYSISISNSSSNDNNSVYLYQNDSETLHLSLTLTQDGDVVILDRGMTFFSV